LHGFAFASECDASARLYGEGLAGADEAAAERQVRSNAVAADAGFEVEDFRVGGESPLSVKPGKRESGMTVRAFPFYLTRVPEKAKNRGNCGLKLSEKGNRARRKGTILRSSG
jgi:hypothetical protein